MTVRVRVRQVSADRQCNLTLKCQTRDIDDTLASRCSKRAARKPPRCGTGAARKIHTVNCHRSGQHYLKSGGPNISGWPVRASTDTVVRRSEKCAGPANVEGWQVRTTNDCPHPR